MRQNDPVKKKINLRIISVFLLICMLITCIPQRQVCATDKVLDVETAKAMALSQNDDYNKLKNKLELAKVQYTQAVKAIRLKEKNQRTFRWSPLLNFKFPEKPDLSEEFEYTYKELELQSEIDMLNHRLTDCVFGVYEKVSLYFTQIYNLQEQIAYNEKRLDSCQRSLDKNRARLSMGLAKQEDIDALEKKLETIKSTLLSDTRSFEAKKEKLGLLIGIDVSTSYTFRNPFVEAELERDVEEELITYTLEHDDMYYQARVALENGLLELNTNYDLMEQQYGGKLKLIDSFITQARNGEKLDSAAFKLKYNELLEKVDAPWQGSYRILFIKIPKEWLKGQIDGVRYVEDEPYALYESAVNYRGLYQEEQSVRKELTASVKDSYNNYVSARNAVESLKRQITKKEKELKEAAYLNATGSMTFDEYTQVQEEYETLQIDLLTAQASYTEILYSFDRLTCGALSFFFKGASTALSSTQGGQSYIVEDEGQGVYYYIHSMVENNIFELGLSVPADFDISITDYELWVDGIRVGERTGVTQSIRHLALDVKEVKRVFIRLFDGDTVIDDCDFNPAIPSGKLMIKTYHVETTDDDYIGTYTTNLNAATGLLELKILMNPDQTVASYNLKTENGVYLISEEKIPVKERFRYLAAMESSLETLTLCLYDETGALLCEARFKSLDRTIRKKDE